MTSLRKHLVTRMLALTIFLLALVGLTVYFACRATLQKNLDLSLVQLAKTELASATDTGYIHIHDASPLTIPLEGLPGIEKYAWVIDDSDRLAAHTHNLAGFNPDSALLESAQVARKHGAHVETASMIGHEVRAVFYPFEDKGHSYVGVVATPVKVYQQTSNLIGVVVLGSFLFASGLAVLLGFLMSKRITSPLEKLATEVSLIDPASGPYVVNEVQPFEELKAVADSIATLSSQAHVLLVERSKTIDAQRRFLADVSHELRTPISNIQGTIEVLSRRDRTKDELIEGIEIVSAENSRMNRLIQDLLLLAKADVGRFEIESREIDLAALALESAAVLRKSCPVGIRLECNVKGPLVISGDWDRLRQAVDNLVKNALAYAASVVMLDVYVEGDEAVLSVSNDGDKIESKDVEVIFDRFKRLDPSRSRDTGGTGLGLSIVRTIIEGHGGRVHLRNDRKVVVFELRLPYRSPIA